MNDSISREEAIRLYCREHCGCEPKKCPMTYERDGTEECSFVRLLKELPSVQQWHVIKKRHMTNDERIEWSERLGYNIEDEEAFIYANLPDDGQEVLVSTQYGNVCTDTLYQDEDGCYFEENGDMDGIVAWMPLPQPYNGESEN